MEDFGSEFEEDPYERFDEEDYVKQHAAFQSEMKCIDKSSPIVHNLMGIGEEVLNIALDYRKKNEDIFDPKVSKYLSELFDKKLKLLPELKEVGNTEEEKPKQDDATWVSSWKRTAPYLKKVLDWKILVPLYWFWHILSGPILSFIYNFVPVMIIKAIYDHVETIFIQNDPSEYVTIENSASQTLKNGKELLMDAFLKGRAAVEEHEVELDLL